MASKSSLNSAKLYQKVKDYNSSAKRKTRVSELIDNKKAEISKGLPALEKKIAKTQAILDSGKGTEADKARINELLDQKNEIEEITSLERKEFIRTEFSHEEKLELKALDVYEGHPHQVEGLVKIIKGYENKIAEEKAQETAMKEEIKSLKKEKAEAKARIEEIRKLSESADNLTNPLENDRMAEESEKLRARVPEIDSAIKTLNEKLKGESEKVSTSKTIHEYEMRIAVCVDALEGILSGKDWDKITEQYGEKAEESKEESKPLDEAEPDKDDVSKIDFTEPGSARRVMGAPTAAKPTGPVVGTPVAAAEEKVEDEVEAEAKEEKAEEEVDPSFVPPEPEEEEKPGFFKRLFGKIKAWFKGEDLKELEAGDDLEEEYDDDEEYDEDYEEDKDHDGERDDREDEEEAKIDSEMFKADDEEEKEDEELSDDMEEKLVKEALTEEEEDKEESVEEVSTEDAEFKKAYAARLKENILAHEVKMIAIHNAHNKENDKSAPEKDEK